MLGFYILNAPQIQMMDEPISVTMVDPIEEKKSDPSRNIVQPSQGEETKEAKKNSYLSDRTRTVQEEKSATMIGSKAAGSPTRALNQDQAHKKVTVSDLGVKINTNARESQENRKNWASNSLGEAVQGGQYIQGLKQGETSALNTKEFIFFSYFERVRKQLDQTWQPLVRSQIERIYKSGRHLASETDFVTRTMITINQRGEIVRVQLLQESGAIDLDAAAVNALNKAGPYPNPPKGLLDENGNAQIRWDFILKT